MGSRRLRSPGEIAEAFGRSPRQVRRWLSDGCPEPPTTKRQVDRWLAARDARRAAKEPRDRSDRAPVDGGNAEEQRLWRQRRRELLELELAEKTGKLVSREAVDEQLAARVAAVKAALLALPRRVAVKLDPAVRDKVRRLIDAEVREMLEAYSQPIDLEGVR